MVRLFSTPPEQLVDARGRPYFLWDNDMTLDEFKHRLRDSGREGRAYLIGKLMRQAKPDDVFTFVDTDEIVELWPLLQRYLGRQRAFWRWLLDHWGCPSRDTSIVLRASNGDDTVGTDLVAEPVPSIEPAQETRFRGVQILVDTPHEVLVNKLCALLHRSELSDLIDIRALLAKGGDLERALADAPRKDGGFSALTLGWTLQGWKVAEVASEAGLEEAAELEQFRDDLLARVAGQRP